ncbi:prolyl oligopeptidase family serine peptidase [Lysobacter sp. HDW10]|uniref:S9 family peptidase n=1 Tax=Lysobacter sp. HDW10 TaxID=2714936 RepID=UPI00140C58F0|nr:S9 family peptidase [Lysobacter sp. HDW10]QIK80946.1 prolyl oligopeptidase family serine peptidase [Lysobacter sp. HDW10]
MGISIRALPLSVALVMAGPALAQNAAVTDADYARAEKMLAPATMRLIDDSVSNVKWLDGDRVLFVERNNGKAEYKVWQSGDQQAKRALDVERLAIELAKASNAKVDATMLPMMMGELSLEKNGSVNFTYAKKRWTCDANYVCQAAEGKVAAAPGNAPAIASPNGKYEVFIRNWNLVLRDRATGKETQITKDGVTDFGYATDNAGWQHSDRPVVVWSPDSTRIATFQQDQRKTSTMALVSTRPGAPVVETWKYPFLGDKDITTIERVIIDVSNPAAAKTVRLKMPADQHRSTFCDDVSCNGGWEDVQWADDGKSLAFVSTDRGHKSAQLRVADINTGAVRDVYKETVATQYESGNGSPNWRYMPETNEFIWFSEKSDWGHLYLHDLTTGKVKKQLTSGNWNVWKIERFDKPGRNLWVQAVGKEKGEDPYYKHFYKVNMGTGEITSLTPESGDHIVSVSDEGSTFVDQVSTINTAPMWTVRDMNTGAVVSQLAHADLTRLKASGWVAPEPFVVKGRDGKTDIYGQMFKPSNFDAKKKYPIITYIYPGPQVGSVRSRSFQPAHGDHQALAELGFIVIAMDGMGTPWRSKSFHDAYYGNMIDNTLPDQVAGLKNLAAKYSWIDLSRAGMWGHSGGGNATATAMFMYPDVYKVGISESGNHDNRLYEDDWAERYHGLMVDKGDGKTNYTNQDNAAHAKNLKGKLFLIHGMMDDNVPPQNTLLVVDALVKANKDFDLLMLPHARHGYGIDSNYVMRRRWDYFVKNLLGAEPPKQYEMGQKK